MRKRLNRSAHLFDGDPEDVRGDNLDDVELQEPPDGQLQLLEVLQELEEEHREAVHHQIPLTPQVWERRVSGKDTQRNREREIQRERERQ